MFLFSGIQHSDRLDSAELKTKEVSISLAALDHSHSKGSKGNMEISAVCEKER